MLNVIPVSRGACLLYVVPATLRGWAGWSGHPGVWGTLVLLHPLIYMGEKKKFDAVTCMVLDFFFFFFVFFFLLSWHYSLL